MSIFFFAILVYSICRTVWGKHLTLGTRRDQKKSKLEVDSPGHVGRLLQAPHPLVSDSNGLLSTEDMATKRPVVFIDVRGVKNEDRLIGLSMLRNLEMCSSSSRFLSSSSWCSSTAIFLLSFCSVCVIQIRVRPSAKEFLHSCHLYSPLERRRCDCLIVLCFLDKWADFLLTEDDAGSTKSCLQDRTSIRLERTRRGIYPKGKDVTTLLYFSIIPGLFFFFSRIHRPASTTTKIPKNNVSLSPHHVPDKTLERHTCLYCFD